MILPPRSILSDLPNGRSTTQYSSIATNNAALTHRSATRYGPVHFLALLTTTIFFITNSSGCELFAFVAQGFSPGKIKALYKLADRPTLVLVDDPSNQLGAPSLPNGIANQVAFHLSDESIVSQANLIEPHHLYDLATKLNKDYSRTPIDRIGRELGAQQVIHIYVQSASYSWEPGMYRPSATVHVKVIDAVQGKRLFPPQRSVSESKTYPENHHTVQVLLPPRTMTDGGHNAVRYFGKPLTERIGRDAARLFFDHLPRQPNEPLEN